MASAPRCTWLWWSSGKDSAWALHELARRDDLRVEALVTTVNAEHDRVAMHAVPVPVLRAQARAVGIDLRLVEIPHPCPNETYEVAVGELIERARAAGVECMAFGDLYLEDVRAYREKLLEGTGIEPLFPLWGYDTRQLAVAMIESGLRAIVTCVDPRAVPAELAGATWDTALLARLPDSADPCGENGEFHTFAFAGPMFAEPLPVRAGTVVHRDGFVFADVVPA